MTAVNKKSVLISFRCSIEAYEKILEALQSPANRDSGVSSYCRNVVERHAFRHSSRKYRWSEV